eukprot:CAMPEP_0174319684 /NCGR_PEP_ID=MMETSP0810-20121108/9038_1 /TAXON_ID=73025 ORGANISM="Eutreptiella gymnastica-like, Strain CCMP1594" /NCGR_SAMPLE_ID=MMETSP0810 /ASSEMBLY_ACC=CAM_ASM_000659 /LENGTH=149 /DNA_ID=CAMNT_0015430327 /DNA_START=227 /DNA_END=674 /DNA_ORIENTATION=+
MPPNRQRKSDDRLACVAGAFRERSIRCSMAPQTSDATSRALPPSLQYRLSQANETRTARAYKYALLFPLPLLLASSTAVICLQFPSLFSGHWAPRAHFYARNNTRRCFRNFQRSFSRAVYTKGGAWGAARWLRHVLLLRRPLYAQRAGP